MPHVHVSRRHVLTQLGAGLGLASMQPNVWAQPAPAGSATAGSLGQGRLVVVFLRGAYDGLSAFVPHGDADYYKIRNAIAIPAPDGTAQTAIKLDNMFGMHPAMSALLPLWEQGVLSFIPAAGLPEPNRSPGWLNKLARLQASHVTALGVGESNPAILAGDARVALIPHGQAAQQSGVLANDKTRQALLDLYAGNDNVSKAFRQGADSRIESAKELSTASAVRKVERAKAEQAQMTNASMSMRAADKDGKPSGITPSMQMMAASNGAADPQGLQLDAQHLATLMGNDPNLRIGFLSAGGWDTHVNQGGVTGQLAGNLGNLTRAITQLRQDFSEPGDTIVVMSEFGRTSAENGTKGTDHGFGNAMWLVGNRIHGGRWHGQWTGLAQANLNQARDLPAHHDYRSVLAQLLRSTFALPDSQLQTILPGAKWDNRLDGMVRKA
jgi:uncharacterized protein (DUF1501 family)